MDGISYITASWNSNTVVYTDGSNNATYRDATSRRTWDSSFIKLYHRLIQLDYMLHQHGETDCTTGVW